MKRIFTRRRKGQPTGGQFAPQQRHEAGLSLAEDRALTQSQAELEVALLVGGDVERRVPAAGGALEGVGQVRGGELQRVALAERHEPGNGAAVEEVVATLIDRSAG